MKREGRTRGTGGLVVAVMQIGPALFGVRNRTAFFARECKGRAENPHLTEDGQRRCEHAQPRYRATTHSAGATHWT